ncbi:DinB family protein [Paenibacillus sp. AK002]
MNMKELLLQNWDYAMDQEDWYPPILPALKEVTLEQALWKPEGEAANSIWENVQHLLYYKQRLLGRLEGRPLHNEGIGNDETFLIHDTNEEAWDTARNQLQEVHATLRQKFEAMTEAEIEESPQRILSLIMHDAYHTGQIVFIRKLQGSWPARRSEL